MCANSPKDGSWGREGLAALEGVEGKAGEGKGEESLHSWRGVDDVLLVDRGGVYTLGRTVWWGGGGKGGHFKFAMRGIAQSHSPKVCTRTHTQFTYTHTRAHTNTHPYTYTTRPPSPTHTQLLLA